MYPYHNLPVMLLPSNECDDLPPPPLSLPLPTPFVSDSINGDAVISDFLGYSIAPTHVSLCHCLLKISISFYCNYKCHDMLLSLQMSVLFNRLFSRPSYSYNFPNRCLDYSVDTYC